MPDESERKTCNICGGQEFRKVPSRKAEPAQPPVCTGCGSLERHRIFRRIFESLEPEGFSELSCLQFSLDPSIDPAWFARRDISIYGHRNSLDLQAIDLPDGAYDIVVCNHVLEHVEDDRAAIRELCRITSPDGFVFLSTPQPKNRYATRDWGYAKADEHGHFRVYGMDIVEKFSDEVPHMTLTCLWSTDPVTGTFDVAFLLAKDPRRIVVNSDGGVSREPIATP
jgi:SAM-dependent methyltransferase